MDWLKLDSKGILRGSLSAAPDTTQLIWVKLLALANETRDRDGYLRRKEGEPFTLLFIAEVCNVSISDLQAALCDFRDDVRDGHPRMEFADDGSIHLLNWEQYQHLPEDKKRLSARELELVERKKIHQLAEKYPNEAFNTPAVRKQVDIMLGGLK